MREGKGINQPTTVMGFFSGLVITIGSLLESHAIIEAVLDGLKLILPAIANQTTAVLVFLGFIALLIVGLYWLKRHYDHKASGPYQAPKRTLSRKGKPRKRR